MATNTRSTTRNGGSEADRSASTTEHITPPPPKRTPASTTTKLPSINKLKTRGASIDVGRNPQKVEIVSAKDRKRKLNDSEEESAEDTTPSKSPRVHMVASYTNHNRNKSTTEAIPPRDLKKMEFPSVEAMALKNFTEILAYRKVNVPRAEMRDFSDLEIDVSEHQIAVVWKAISGSTPSSVMIPDTATFGECSVFAVKANTKERFEEKAKKFLGHNMGSETLKRSMALVLHYDGDGKLRSAIVSYSLGSDLQYSDGLKVKTANNIVMQLNRGKGPERWHLELPRKGRSKRMKLVDTSRSGRAKDESDDSSD